MACAYERSQEGSDVGATAVAVETRRLILRGCSGNKALLMTDNESRVVHFNGG